MIDGCSWFVSKVAVREVGVVGVVAVVGGRWCSWGRRASVAVRCLCGYNSALRF